MHGYAQHLNVSAEILEGLSLVCMEVYRRHIEFNIISNPVGVSQDSGHEEVGRGGKGPS